jgi:hypothetical protein
MARFWRALVALWALSAAVPASAQSIPYSETFDAGSLPAGWTETHTDLGVPAVQWSVDATPATVAGGPSTFGGSTGSLNYNDGTNYDTGVTNSGSVTSPAITVGGAASISVSFQCNYQTETALTTFDIRTMQVLDGTSLAVITTLVCNSASPGATCAAMGTFHAHGYQVVLPAMTTSVRIRFTFNTVDGILNTFAGWFVDNLSVTCGDTALPTTPTLLFPIGGAPVTTGATLDWTDATDTDDCGPGTVTGYQVEVDTTNPPLAPFSFSATPATSTVTTGALPVGTYFWRVRAVDAAGNLGAYTAVESFVVEPALAPLAPDTLFLNEQNDGAQNGDGGLVDPVVDQQPVFSAIYRDGNTTDTASQLQFQVSDDPTFTTVVFDSLLVTLGALLPDDTRCPDQQISIPLQKDSVYYWRIRFTDNGGLTGPYSAPQTFRIGDGYDFGERVGSSHRSRHGCWVATAAWNGQTEEVLGLMRFRSEVLEASGAGSWFSRAYAAAGRSPARALAQSPARGAARTALTPLATAASAGLATALAAAVAVLLLLVAAFRRL